MPRTTTKISKPAAPDIQSTLFPETLLWPAAKRIRCRPKTQPSTMMANQGKRAYLMFTVGLPYVATVNAAGTEELPGGVQNHAVTIAPNAIQPSDMVSNAQVGNRRSGAMQIIDTPIANST